MTARTAPCEGWSRRCCCITALRSRFSQTLVPARGSSAFLRVGRLALDAGYSTADHSYAMSCLVPMDRLDEALDQMQIAQTLDPVSSIIARDLAVTQYYRREFDAALEECDHTVELNPHWSPAYWILGIIQEQRGDLDESVAAFQRAVHLSRRTVLECRRRSAARSPSQANSRGRSRSCVHWRSSRNTDTSPVRVRGASFRNGARGSGLPVAPQGLRRSCLRDDFAEGRSEIRHAAG
jgi:tetratricopeptide (TPR) repeat protein